MKITTRQFGEIDVDENRIVTFSDGILGFEDLKKFVLITEENGIFFWLTSIDEPEVVFPLFPVRLLIDNCPQEEGCEAFGIVKLDKIPTNITINLKAPVYINQGKMSGFQKIIDKEDFAIDYVLFVDN